MRTSIKAFTLAVLLFCSIFACKKEMANTSKTATSVTQSDQVVDGDCDRKWVGLYADGYQPNDTISQSKFIGNGAAKLPPVDWYYYHTGIYYDIPHCHKINGDTVTFEARVKNPKDKPGSVTDYEVALQIYGSKNYAEVYFAGSTATQSYDHIWIGNYEIWNLPELVHYFGNYETLSVELKNNTLSIFRNGIFVKSVTYDAANEIGKITRIGYGFKGTGSIDWVKLYSSDNNSLIMQEDFNINGKSSVVWY